jgi:hypothetical protein
LVGVFGFVFGAGGLLEAGLACVAAGAALGAVLACMAACTRAATGTVLGAVRAWMAACARADSAAVFFFIVLYFSFIVELEAST